DQVLGVAVVGHDQVEGVTIVFGINVEGERPGCPLHVPDTSTLISPGFKSVIVETRLFHSSPPGAIPESAVQVKVTCKTTSWARSKRLNNSFSTLRKSDDDPARYPTLTSPARSGNVPEPSTTTRKSRRGSIGGAESSVRNSAVPPWCRSFWMETSVIFFPSPSSASLSVRTPNTGPGVPSASNRKPVGRLVTSMPISSAW